ncbi:hypothetical protein HZB97_00520 [Candidatus Gottesmanbacteria bacterium]|nr:hypothetical protein [Candidatus Gottesmanbacteria bacterium]
MEKHKLKAEKRKITGRKVKKLRQQGILPANMYGKGIKSLAVQLPVKDFLKVYEAAGETGIIELSLGQAKPDPVLVHNLQTHPCQPTFQNTLKLIFQNWKVLIRKLKSRT